MHRISRTSVRHLVKKHQLLQAYKLTSPYFQNTVEVSKSIPLILNTYCQDIQAAMKACLISENAEVSLEVTIKGTQYKKGHYVVLSRCEHGLLFGEIRVILLNSSTQVYFLVEEFKSQLSEKNACLHIIAQVITSFLI